MAWSAGMSMRDVDDRSTFNMLIPADPRRLREQRTSRPA